MMSAFSVTSAQWQKKHVITVNVVTVRISQCYKWTATKIKIQLNMGQSGSSEGQKGCIYHSCKKFLKTSQRKNSRPPGICLLLLKINAYGRSYHFHSLSNG